MSRNVELEGFFLDALNASVSLLLHVIEYVSKHMYKIGNLKSLYN